MQVEIELIPTGTDAQNVRPGDFILCHRKGLISAIIRWGERIRLKKGKWSHAAFCETPDTLIEALAHGVTRTPLSAYRHVQYAIVRTHLSDEDAAEAVAFARSCIGQHYAWSVIASLIFHFLTPQPQSQICSGFVAETQVRGPAIFPSMPHRMTPEGLEIFYSQFTS